MIIKIYTVYAFLTLILLSVWLTVGCQTFQYESQIMKQSQAKGVKFKKTAAELRLQLNDLAGIFAGTIERAADQVIAESANNDITRHALLWKINAIPTAYQALYQPDPAVAFIDTWAFSMQMVDYFNNGPGKDDFDQWHRIALDASRRLEKEVMEHGTKFRADGNIKPLGDKVQTWVRENPIERDFVYRETVVPELGSIFGNEEMGAFQTVGSIAVSVEEISYRLAVYMNLLTKQARWQAELVMKGTENKPGIQDGLVALNELGSFANRLTPMVEQTPDLIAREREIILKAIQQERIEVLADISRQRLAVLKYLTGVQLSVTEDLKTERRIVMDILQSERKTVLQSINEQRVATLTELESAGNRIVDNVLKQSKPLIDYIFIRVLQVVAVLLLCGMVGAVILVRMMKKRPLSMENRHRKT